MIKCHSIMMISVASWEVFLFCFVFSEGNGSKFWKLMDTQSVCPGND